PTISQRFRQEALAASRVRHPNAIDVTDYGVDKDNVPFIVMELVEGETLGDILRREGPVTVERAANILRQICGALDVAHEVGVIHRDIKPDNILIADHEGQDWVEVTDFGVAKIQEDVNRRAALTGADFIIGTPRYMSPEQCDERPVDARSDIYSLGVVLYEMLSGDTPFTGNSTRLLIAHSTEPPAPLREKRPDLSPEIEAVVMSALEKDPTLRPQSASEFYRQFAGAAGFDQESERADSGAFSRLIVPVENERPAHTLADDEPVPVDTRDEIGYEEDDEATLVRSRPAQERRTRSSRRNRRTLLPIAALVLIVALVVAAFWLLRDNPETEAPPSEPVAEQSQPPQQAPSEAATPDPIPESPPSPSATRPPETSPSDTVETVDPGRATREIETALHHWAASLEERNLRAHMDSYAPNLHRYYLRRGVSRVYVQADRAQALTKYSDISFRFSNMDIKVDPSGRRAVATFDKEWDFRGAQNSSGSVREMVWLEKAGGRWRITGERDLRVHYARSG
ncbi:MAG TPA: serine/threonine-protein kinase, partial [Blastocatellia bacterium]|nr:serine/threonine-protein kinase [Blastocatellia bacterium]